MKNAKGLGAPSLIELASKLKKTGIWRGAFYKFSINIASQVIETKIGQSTGNEIYTRVATMMVTYPFELTSVLVRLNLVENMWEGISQIYSKGIMGFFKGFVPLLAYNCMYLFVAHYLETHKINNQINEKANEVQQQGKHLQAFGLRAALSIAKVTILTLVTTPLKTITVREQALAIAPASEGFGKRMVDYLTNKPMSGFFVDALYNLASRVFSEWL